MFGIDTMHNNVSLHRILSAALPHIEPSFNFHCPPWDAGFFQLDQVTLFLSASEQEQAQILQLTNQSLLLESYGIERAGIIYMAKMVGLAETLEEQMLYGLFAADETMHLHLLSPYVSAPVDEQQNSFLQLLTELLADQDKAVLLLVIQIVLEGWGLHHYRRLAQSCCEPALAKVFTSFLEAEARHHGTGSVLFRQVKLSAKSQTKVIAVLTLFLEMVQIGPQSVLTAIQQVKGDLTRAQKIQILEELDSTTHSGSRLKLLRSLLKSVPTIVQSLDEKKAFEPRSTYACV